MKPAVSVGMLLIIILSCSTAINSVNAQPSSNFISNVETPSNVAIRVGGDLGSESTLQAQRILENKGLLYDVLTDTNSSSLAAEKYALIIVVGSTQPQFGTDLIETRNAVERGAGLIWIGQDLPATLQDLMGLSRKNTIEIEQGTTAIRYADSSTQLFTESVDLVDATQATPKGYFIDNSGLTIAPAELSFKKGTAGLTYYFAYDAFAWWFADQENPWLRAYRIHLAIEDVLSEHTTIRLMPYPRGMQSAFVTRIEDVDPLHTSPEWLGRAEKLLNYYTEKDATLSVALTPTYVDPALGLNFGIEEPTAQSLKDWLSRVLMRGGTIIEHGYTHQVNGQKTGVSPEFFDDSTQTWLSLENQKTRIATGANQIHASLGFEPKGFEAPHYVANSDTYHALSELGFEYVTHNTNTAFFDRFNLTGKIVNVPETLGYIPLDSSENATVRIKSNMDYLDNMGAVMLYFNHLFDDQMLNAGEDLLNYAIEKGNVWVTNTGSLANFWAQRYNAYKDMTLKTVNDKTVSIELGASARAGLTLVIDNAPQIRSVSVNGYAWSVFDGNQVILPALSNSSNTVVLSFEEASTNTNQLLGYPIILVSVVFSLLIVLKRINFGKHSNLNRLGSEKQ